MTRRQSSSQAVGAGADRTYFLVLSFGYSGSFWLGSTLDRHPQISCTANQVIGLTLPHGTTIGNKNPLKMAGLESEARPATIDEQFDRVAERKPALAVGDVHGWNGTTYFEAAARAPHRPARIAHVLRNPIVLLERIRLEHVHRFTRFQDFRAGMMRLLPSIVASLADILTHDRWKSPSEVQDIAFICALNDLMRMIPGIINTQSFPQYRFEELMGSPALLAQLISYLTNGLVEVDDRYLDEIFDPAALDKTGRYRNTGVDRNTSAGAVFDRWPAHEQDAVFRLCSVIPLRPLYEKLGYQLDFLH